MEGLIVILIVDVLLCMAYFMHCWKKTKKELPVSRESVNLHLEVIKKYDLLINRQPETRCIITADNQTYDTCLDEQEKDMIAAGDFIQVEGERFTYGDEHYLSFQYGEIDTTREADAWIEKQKKIRLTNMWEKAAFRLFVMALPAISILLYFWN